MHHFSNVTPSIEILISHIRLVFAHVGKDNTKNNNCPLKNKYVQEQILRGQIQSIYIEQTCHGEADEAFLRENTKGQRIL